ncbi:Lipoprotein, ToxR-activated, TagA [Pseudomonas syringae pv. primulae]|uniref:Lipoprotein, ToxR-activated, TagA n=2 Tax=Pseudomonas syringae group genomosp. 3 TaxID=251701 RepID=A0A3M4RSR5_9PSED|nr:Lipoprotein, ToxR-activated, TagA [Pseudomonas syringae pv. primulae]
MSPPTFISRPIHLRKGSHCMNTGTALTVVDDKLLGRFYEGLVTQKFRLESVGIGFFAVRSVYNDTLITMSKVNVWLSLELGTPEQFFELRMYDDASYTIHGVSNQLVLEMTGTGIEPREYDKDSQNQRFFLVPQDSGSISICKANHVFNTRQRINDLQGDLQASVQFAQSQIFSVTASPGSSQPHLTAGRRTLLMVKPQGILSTLKVTVLGKEGRQLGSLLLNSPEHLPETVYHVEGVVEGMNFAPLPGSTLTINSHREIERLGQPSADFLLERLQQHAVVDIQPSDCSGVTRLRLPDHCALDGKMVRIRAGVGNEVTVLYDHRSTTIEQGNSQRFKFFSGHWISEDDQVNNSIIYAENTWSVDLPAEWIEPGIVMNFQSGTVSGQLKNISVGARTELLINTIDIGMLTSPRNAFAFAKDPSAHREYFQTIPVSRMIVNNYESIHLTEVVLPDGTLLDGFDPSQGSWHAGTMRQRIGKELISLGINHANYGINSFEGEAGWGPYVAAQITAHNSRGKYANGVIVHGGSGGAGMVTLDQSLGNEFSHELGHNYGLGHYPGGFDGCVHRDAGENNSTWGWDMDLSRFIPNFRSSITHEDACFGGQCQPPFFGRRFDTDPMAGGSVMSSLNRFTLHTPYTAALTQTFFEGKPVFDKSSPTRFSKWDPEAKAMKPHTHRVDREKWVLASNADLSENVIFELLSKNRYVRVYMADGNWSPSVHIPLASSVKAGCLVAVESNAQYSSQLHINGQVITVKRGDAKSYHSNGTRWNECVVLNSEMNRITAPVDELSQSALGAFLSTYHVVRIAMWNGSWAAAIHVPEASQANKRRVIIIVQDATYTTYLTINGLVIPIPKGTTSYYMSDGYNWNAYTHLFDFSIERSPRASGVPVTTLVGYYDPEMKLRSYIYPALHGAYGFLYDEDTGLNDDDCFLWIESPGESRRFKLDGTRLKSGVMNAFHINIAESSQRRTVSIFCKGEILSSRYVFAAEVPLTYTVNGE